MKTLREARKSKSYTLKGLADVSNCTRPQLSCFENGKYSPSIPTRKWLETILGEKINWLDVPINMESREPPADWKDCEREFRGFIHMIASLPDDERNVFIETIVKHINKLKTKDNGKLHF